MNFWRVHIKSGVDFNRRRKIQSFFGSWKTSFISKSPIELLEFFYTTIFCLFIYSADCWKKSRTLDMVAWLHEYYFYVCFYQTPVCSFHSFVLFFFYTPFFSTFHFFVVWSLRTHIVCIYIDEVKSVVFTSYIYQ